ncbi:MAG: SUMF1/EgtB/PvdO family nonheme iron enzyme [Rectinemataceae bacterium]|nr:SUMF1/EgtB/PvdO family nonheme iron enzyme [Rectinemataceae bacterium]
MKEEKKITQSDIDEASVHLGPIAGIQPRIYLPAAYAVATVVLLFILLVLPGIRKHGSYLVFEGRPEKSAVYVDEAYKGSTGQSIYLPSGEHSIRIGHEGFSPENRIIKVGGRLFGSLFFPRHEKVAYSLKADDAEKYLHSAFKDYASWSLAGKPSALYQIPSVLSDAAAALGPQALVSTASPDAGGFTADILSATASAESARDGLKASLLMVGAGIPGPLSLASAARTILSALCSEKAGAVWLQDILPKKGASSTKVIAALSAAAAAAVRDSGDFSADESAKAPKPQGSIRLGAHEYLLFGPGSLSLGGEAPSGSLAGYEVELPRFGLARSEVTNRQWSAFLSANPYWKPENRAALTDAGLADESYLADWGQASVAAAAAENPVTGVSWAAATAYCEWLSTSSGTEWKAILPSEAMWEVAARAGLNDPAMPGERQALWSDGTRTGPAPVGSLGLSKVGLADMFGNVWEWTSDAYRPYPAFANSLSSGDEKSVRGGSWANPSDTISLYSRGGVPQALASAFLGFRPAIVER